MQGNDFKYLLTTEGNTTELIFSPEGWDSKSEVSYKRSPDYFGMIRSMGLPLQFVEDGAKIIRRARYNRGIEAVIAIEVQQLNRSTWVYEQTFLGEIDLSEFDDEDGIVTVTIIDGGASKNIKAYEGVDYEINLIGSDVVKINLPGVAIAESSEGSFQQYISGNADDYIPGSDMLYQNMSPSFAISKSADKSGNSPDFSTSTSYFLRTLKVLNIKASVHIEGAFQRLPTGGNTNAEFQVRNQNGTLIYSYSLGSGYGATFIRSFDFEFVSQIDAKYFFYFSTSAVAFIGLTGGDYKISYSSQAETSECLGLKSYDLFNRLIQKMSPGTKVTSYLLSNTWKNLIFTCGDAIRQNEKPKINISFKDFFKTMTSIDDTAFGIERPSGQQEVAVMEVGSYFARNFESANVGEVSKCSISNATDYIFNSFRVGYDDGNTDETNGKQEYNSGQVWYDTITRIKKEKDWVSPTRADQFGIEEIRTKYIQDPTTDNSEDNNAFMIHCYDDGVNITPILGIIYQSVTGITDPNTAYNLALTPKKNLLRHSGFLRSMLDNMDDKYINFGSGDKNTELKTVLDGVGIKENENILVGSLTGKYFIPYIAKITCKLPIGIKKLFDQVPYGYVSFIYNEVTLKGYIIDAAVDIAENKEQDFELLLTNNNDLSKLI